MGFQDFLGNTATVTHLRESVRAGRFPHSLILAGPRGAGKYTLALMLAQAVNCLNPTETDGLPDFCGQCPNCTRIADSANLEALVAEAVDAREDLRETDKRETRILIQTHPDVLVVPPDPPQLLIKLGQVRQVIHVAYYRPPVEAQARLYHLHLLGLYERGGQQPAQSPRRAARAHLADPAHRESPGAAAHHPLPRRRSPPGRAARRRSRNPARPAPPRTASPRTALWPPAWPKAPWAARSPRLAAYLAEPPGRAGHAAHRPARCPDYSQLFHATESYRAGADGQEKTINLLRALGSLVEDLLLVVAGTPALIRNLDLAAELDRLAQGLTVDWIDGAARALVQVEQGMRRNLLRSLSLDAMAVSLSAEVPLTR